MSVPVGKRNKNKFEAIVKTQALVKHILLITKNEKILSYSVGDVLSNEQSELWIENEEWKNNF